MGLTGQGLADYGKSKVGTPYFYGMKMATLTTNKMNTLHNMYPSIVTNEYMRLATNNGQVGRVNTDCSGLISAYTAKVLGSSQLYQQAYTSLSVSDYKHWANGVIAWRSGHVGIFFQENGKYYVVEAKGISYGTVISEFDPSKWTKGLTFSWMTYQYVTNVVNNATWKGTNPYAEPNVLICTSTVAKNRKYAASKWTNKGDGVKWLQWELNEAGCVGKDGKPLTVDGIFGANSEYALGQFQQSCKITKDYICGPTTRKYLKAN